MTGSAQRRERHNGLGLLGRTALRWSCKLLLQNLIWSRGGKRLRGDGWQAFLIGWPKPDTLVINKAVTFWHRRILECLRSDFDAISQNRPPLLVVCCAKHITIEDVLRSLQLDRFCDLSPEDAPMGGAYIKVIDAIFVSAEPGCPEFEYTLAHELCHAFCHRLMGSMSTAVWADEGYATWVPARVSSRMENILNSHPSTFLRAQQVGNALPLRELLSITCASSSMFSDHAGHSQAALFVAFLQELRAAKPDAWNSLKLALCGALEPGPRTIEVFEEVLETTFGQIERDFTAFAVRAAQKGRVPETEREETTSREKVSGRLKDDQLDRRASD